MDGQLVSLTINDLSQFLQSVRDYYDHAFNTLVIVGGLIVGTGAILLPILVQWWQKRQLRMESKAVEEKLRNEINEKIEKKIVDYRSEIDLKLAKATAELTGSVFHLQANTKVTEKKYGEALDSYTTAAGYYFAAKNEMDLQKMLDSIIRVLNVIEIEKDYRKNKPRLDELLQMLGKENHDRRYSNHLMKISEATTSTEEKIAAKKEPQKA